MARNGEDKPDKDKRKAPQSIYDIQLSEASKVFLKKYRTPIASGASSIISTFIAFPLDFAKTRMQSYHTKFIPTLLDAYRVEGLRSFWRGVGPPLYSVTVVRTISFSLYQKAKYAYAGQLKGATGESPLDIANAKNRYPTLSTLLCFGAAGATAGSLVTVIACPFELTKLRAQLAGKMARDAATPDKVTNTNIKSGTLETAKQLIRDRGFKGLYSGYKLHLIRDTIGTSIYFMTYESAKQILGNARGNSPTSPFAVMAGGGICGIISWVCTYPIDVAKTVYQKRLLATGSSHVDMPRIEFFNMGSYRGLGVSVTRSAIINMIFFSSFELIKKTINAL